VVTLRDEAGCSFREIAAALGIPENTAVTVYYRYVNGRGAT
jgi:DNA-directed RNA polymerase specialized sigma24 family protein